MECLEQRGDLKTSKETKSHKEKQAPTHNDGAKEFRFLFIHVDGLLAVHGHFVWLAKFCAEHANDLDPGISMKHVNELNL